jgi:hypothetical protein
MSRIFFDELIEVDEIKMYLDNVVSSFEEKEDLWNLVDEFINRKIIYTILEALNDEYHDEFMTMFLEKPYSNEIVNYLNAKLNLSLEELIQRRHDEIINDLFTVLEIQVKGDSYNKHKKSVKVKKHK